jgi:hypothetical protein
MSEPNISHEITTNTVEWNFTRPYNPSNQSKVTHIRAWVENPYNDNFGAVEFSFYIDYYCEENPRDGDIMQIYILFSGNLTRGFFYDLQVNFSQIDPYAYLDIRVDNDVMKLQNLAVPQVKDSYATNEPLMRTMAVGHPSNCSLDMHADWYFLDENSATHGVNHEFTATAQVTFYDGSEYLRIYLPMKFKVVST